MDAISPILLDNAQLDLSMGRFRSAQKSIDRYLEIHPHSADAHFYKAELYRQKGHKNERERAINEYSQAARLDPSFAEPHKGLGMIYFKNDQNGLHSIFRYLNTASQCASLLMTKNWNQMHKSRVILTIFQFPLIRNSTN